MTKDILNQAVIQEKMRSGKKLSKSELAYLELVNRVAADSRSAEKKKR